MTKSLGDSFLTDFPKLNAALEHSITPTYQKGEMVIRAHEKIGMGEVKIHSVLLRD